MKAYKAFNNDMTCRDFQYKEGETYTFDGHVKLCKRGFHACENPLDVFGYYPPTSPIHEVELNEVSDERKNDSKVVAKEITIGARISLASLTKFAVDFIFKKIDWENAKESNTGQFSAATNTGDYSAATNTGDYSAATNTGYRSAATNTGHYSAVTNTGDYSAATNTGAYSAATNTGYRSAVTNTGQFSAATNTGDQSAATNTGDQSAATNTGDQSAATNTGDHSAATNTGNHSAATNTGHYSAAEVSGRDSVAIATGYGSKVRGKKGCAIVCVERDDWNGSTYPLLSIKSDIVDGEKIKEDVWYTVKNGEWVELN